MTREGDDALTYGPPVGEEFRAFSTDEEIAQIDEIKKMNDRNSNNKNKTGQ